jgi:hypothetical protein
MAHEDINQLKTEIERIDRKLELLVGPEREAGARKLRQVLLAAGSWMEDQDEQVLSSWVAGELPLDAFVAHFGTRISNLP